MANRGIDLLTAGAALVGAGATASRAVLEYRKFRQERETREYTRDMQRRAWQKLMDGELAFARVSDMELRAPANRKIRLRPSPRPGASTEGDADE